MLLSKHTLCGALALLALLPACMSNAPTPAARPAEPTEEVQPTQEARHPVRVTLHADDAPTPGTPLKLTLTAEHHLAFEAPLVITLKPPAGVTLAGPTRFEIPARSAPGVQTWALLLSFDKLPDDDLIASAALEGAHMGYHAQIPYRFGRPEPLPANPARGGKELKVNGRNLGRPILMPTP